MRAKTRDAGVVEELLVTPIESGPDRFSLDRRSPVGRGTDRPGVGREADERALPPVAAACELADVELAAPRHVGCSGVADVGIVRPDDDLRAVVMSREMRR